MNVNRSKLTAYVKNYTYSNCIIVVVLEWSQNFWAPALWFDLVCLQFKLFSLIASSNRFPISVFDFCTCFSLKSKMPWNSLICPSNLVAALGVSGALLGASLDPLKVCSRISSAIFSWFSESLSSDELCFSRFSYVYSSQFICIKFVLSNIIVKTFSSCLPQVHSEYSFSFSILSL